MSSADIFRIVELLEMWGKIIAHGGGGKLYIFFSYF